MNQRTNLINRNIMKTILITGGTGFIGSHTTVELQKAGYNVVIADNLSNSNENVIDNIEKITNIRPSFIKVDLSKEDECKKVFDKYPKI
jgi:UDP-glucose 4-epimerase